MQSSPHQRTPIAYHHRTPPKAATTIYATKARTETPPIAHRHHLHRHHRQRRQAATSTTPMQATASPLMHTTPNQPASSAYQIHERHKMGNTNHLTRNANHADYVQYRDNTRYRETGLANRASDEHAPRNTNSCAYPSESHARCKNRNTTATPRAQAHTLPTQPIAAVTCRTTTAQQACRHY